MVSAQISRLNSIFPLSTPCHTQCFFHSLKNTIHPVRFGVKKIGQIFEWQPDTSVVLANVPFYSSNQQGQSCPRKIIDAPIKIDPEPIVKF